MPEPLPVTTAMCLSRSPVIVLPSSIATRAVAAHLQSWAHWTSPLPCATLSEKAHPKRFGEVPMTILRMLAAVMVAAFASATGPAQAQMKTEWVEYSHGDTKL